MPTFLMISRHSPENCDAFNEEARKVTMELMGKLEGLVKKHGIKMLWVWVWAIIFSRASPKAPPMTSTPYLDRNRCGMLKTIFFLAPQLERS